MTISSRDNARPRPPTFTLPFGGGLLDCVPPALGWAVGCGADPTAGGAFDVTEFVGIGASAGGAGGGAGGGVGAGGGGAGG